uniref:Secreted protein n=1 Tax=Anguilla anguilla TaxID=7936 RepID=A0A0E9Y152_ANGAN
MFDMPWCTLLAYTVCTACIHMYTACIHNVHCLHPQCTLPAYTMYTAGKKNATKHTKSEILSRRQQHSCHSRSVSRVRERRERHFSFQYTSTNQIQCYTGIRGEGEGRIISHKRVLNFWIYTQHRDKWQMKTEATANQDE